MGPIIINPDATICPFEYTSELTPSSIINYFDNINHMTYTLYNIKSIIILLSVLLSVMMVINILTKMIPRKFIIIPLTLMIISGYCFYSNYKVSRYITKNMHMLIRRQFDIKSELEKQDILENNKGKLELEYSSLYSHTKIK